MALDSDDVIAMRALAFGQHPESHLTSPESPAVPIDDSGATRRTGEWASLESD